MDKKIHHSAFVNAGVNAKRSKGGNKAQEHEHERDHQPKAKSSSSTSRSHRGQAHRAGAKGSLNEMQGEEFDHHDLHESSERKKEAWEVQKTVQAEHDRDDQDDSKNKDSAAQQQMLQRRLALRQAGNLLAGKKAKPKKELPQVAAAKRDGFERISAKKVAQLNKTKQAKLETPLGPRIPPQQMTVAPHYLLKDVRDAGEFFDQVDEDGSSGSGEQGAPEEDVDPEWQAAVVETARKLTGVRGITGVCRGLSDQDEPIVLVMTALGLTGATFEQLIPAEVRGYPTLVAIPFDALPLRRERPVPSLSITP